MALVILNVAQSTTRVSHDLYTPCKILDGSEDSNFNISYMSYDKFISQLTLFIETVVDSDNSSNERESFGLLAYHISKHVYCSCRVLSSSRTEAQITHFAKLATQLSSALLQLLLPLQRKGSNCSFYKRQTIAFVVTGFIKGACIARHQTCSGPLCDSSLLQIFIPIICRLRSDSDILIRINCLEMCSYLLGIDHPTDSNVYKQEGMPFLN